MSDIIVNVSEYMRENVRNVDCDRNEREVLAYLGLAMTKIFLISETSHEWSDDFKKMIRGIGPELKEMARIEDESASLVKDVRKEDENSH